MAALPKLRRDELPWALDNDQNRQFKRILQGTLAVFLLLGVIIPFLPVPEVDRSELEELPPQLARLIMERTPPPPPEIVRPEPVAQEEVPVEAPAPPVPEVPPEPRPQPQQTQEQARERAAQSGLLEMRDSFADMRQALDTSALQTQATASTRDAERVQADRNLLDSRHGTRSGGVSASERPLDTGGVELAGREVTRVDVVETASAPASGRNTPTDRNRGGRSTEEVRRIFDQNRGSIFTIYNRALRSNPALQGEVVLELVIAPSGRVISCDVISAELADAEVLARIRARVMSFDFGARDVAETTIRYPIRFFPGSS